MIDAILDVLSGALTVFWNFLQKLYDDPNVRRFLRRIMSELVDLILDTVFGRRDAAG